ncbi:hypothetical protein [Peribacillus asahii]|uniref:hypothetical protein n=1 Tax=Peribacillus asahii TaxID=228899 RepID=UPI0020795629|nr:hypothetical protein [Peribacillus asahii]USK60412.1 hypothetical protein LIT37_03410 [Peribacillus asahii]
MIKVYTVRDFIEHKIKDISVWIDGELYAYPIEGTIMKYEDIINQIVFEVFFSIYLTKSPATSLKEFVKKQGLEEDTSEFDKFYKRVQREYKAYKDGKYNQYLKICEIFNVDAEHKQQDGIQFINFDKMEEKLEGHKLKEYQAFQLLRLLDNKSIRDIKSGALCDSKKKSSDEVIQTINDIESIYLDIQNQSNLTIFGKSVQYFQLEDSIRLEYFYRIIMLLKENNLKKKDRDTVRENLGSLIGVTNGRSYFRNNFIISNYSSIYQLHKKDLNENSIKKFTYKLGQEIFSLSALKYAIKRELYKEFDFFEVSFDAQDIVEFSKIYLGMGQHIERDKVIEEPEVKQFRKLWRSTV